MTSASKLNNDYQYMTFVMRFTLSGIEYFEMKPGIKNSGLGAPPSLKLRGTMSVLGTRKVNA
jgi:hypothetical protein